MCAADRVGFMQGRLSPQINGLIQAFPWDHWADEFSSAEPIGFRLMEWTLDQARIAENPLMTAAGREHILQLSKTHALAVPSITGDCFMQAPFWKSQGKVRDDLLQTAADVIRNGAAIGARIVVVPLVDTGALTTPDEEEALRSGAHALAPLLADVGSQIAFSRTLSPNGWQTSSRPFPRRTLASISTSAIARASAGTRRRRSPCCPTGSSMCTSRTARLAEQRSPWAAERRPSTRFFER